MMKQRRAIVCSIALLWPIIFAIAGCRRAQQPSEVVVYTALDEEFSQPIFDNFTRQTGIAVRTKFDVESTKTVNLAQSILSERARPRCDMFWNNEIINTYRLQKAGLLRSYKAAAAASYPPSAHSPDGTWYGFAARARVLIVNTNKLPKERWPKSIRDLTDPQWHDRCAIAKPLFGTTATHAACLFAAWGDKEAKEFFKLVKGNVQIMSGNRDVARAVGSNTPIAFGLTDTDDALIEIASGQPVDIIYPDQRPSEIGTLFIPNTLALVKDSPHQAQAEKLLEYLLSPAVERQLADGPSAQIPLQPSVEASPRVKTPVQVKAMQIDWPASAAKWDTASAFLRDEFTGAD
jgi:iron(III) transport system substrate-binding protein